MEKHKYKDYLKKYFDILYKMSREEISDIVMRNYYHEEERIKQLLDYGIDEIKVFGVFLNKIIFNAWNISKKDLSPIYKICKERPEFAKELRNNLNKSAEEDYIYGNAVRILEAIYCYNNFNNDEDVCRQYIDSIEKCELGTIKNIFNKQITAEQLNQIEEIMDNREEYDEEKNEKLIDSFKSYKYS